MFAADTTRRGFLATAATVGLTAAGCGSGSDVDNELPPRTEVVVIGAGIAGLAAAAALVAEDYDVVVLEARQRVGGRVFTSRDLGGLPVDLGAAWIHGVNDNPLSALADEEGIETVAFDVGGDTDGGTYATYRPDGRELTDAETAIVDEDLGRVFASLEQQAEATDSPRSAPSLGSAIPVALLEARLRGERAAFARRAVTAAAQDYGADPSTLSLAAVLEEDAYPGAHHVFPEGFSQLAEALADGVDVRFRHRAEAVRRVSDGVDVQTNRGVIRADQVIVTVPLGVLRAGAIAFDPPLPAGHRTAISRLKMGRYEKLLLQFDDVFWDDVDLIQVAQAPGEPFSGWFNLQRPLGEPVLVALNGGAAARALNGLSTQQRAARGLTVLRTLYGDSVPTPTAAISTDWMRDPYARGAYSYTPVGASPDDREQLSAGIDGRLWLAGEATDPVRHSTVHGALAAGRRAARALMEA